MAVPEQTPYIEHTGNGATTSFALKFQCESKDHLIVLVDEIEPPIETWSLTGGNVVFTTAPAAGKKITLQRNTPFSRTTDYQSYNNSFRPPAVNKDFDWIWLKLQELGVADWILGNRIDALKNYVDDRDDELRAYLMEEIRKQGVALDQLDEYYNYLMQRLAQIAVDKGWDASFVVDGDQTQKEINALILDPNSRIPTDKMIKTWSGRTQESKNKDEINVLDFGAVLDGLGDSTVAIQRAIDYAASLSTNSNRKKVVIDIPVKVSKQRTHSTGWGSVFTVPSNVVIEGTGCIFTDHLFANRCVIFLCRGSNINVNWLTFNNTATSASNYDIPVGGGTTYDDGLISGTTYSNIQCYQLLGLNSWITCSFQMSNTDDGTIKFKDIEYIFCKSTARPTAASAGNFNFRSDPPHKIENAKMIGCSGKNGKTASSFNYVGIKRGSVSICDSELNFYGACEIENGCEGIVVNNLRSLNDAVGLWIDDSRQITANGIYMENTIETIVSPLLGTLPLNRSVVWITVQGFAADPTYVTADIVISNVVAKNSTIVADAFGTSLGGDLDSISISNVSIRNDGVKRSGKNVPVNISRKCKHISLSNISIVGAANDSYELVLNSDSSMYVSNFKSRRVGSEVPLGLNAVGLANLTLDNVSLQAIAALPSGLVQYNNVKLNGVIQPQRLGLAQQFFNKNGSPEGSQIAPIGSTWYRVDDPVLYYKTTDGSLNTGWKRLAFAP